MGNSVTTATGALTRATGSIVNGNYTIIVAFKFVDSPAVSVFRGVLGMKGRVGNPTTGVPIELSQMPSDSRNAYVWFTKTPGGGSTYSDIGTNAALNGHWIHAAIVYTGNGSAGTAHVYGIQEGFNAGSPSWLLDLDIGSIDPVVTSGETRVFYDPDDELLDGGLVGHYLLIPQALSSAQILAQFGQRAPTATVTSGGSYTYLPCTNAASVEVDAGTLATNFTKSGGNFTDSADQPLEWGVTSNTLFFGGM